MKLLMIADDFTGALDSGVQLSKKGVRTKVIVGRHLPERIDDTEVLVLDAESRHLTPAEAGEIAKTAAAEAKAAGIPYFYKKTDSALRGNVGSEICGAMEGFGAEQVLFVPAFPKTKRATIDGVHYVGGVPVSESSFGRDPFNPVTADRVDEILHQTAGNIDAVKIFDCETEEDMAAIAKKMGEEGAVKPGLTVLSGCAGLAEYLPDLLNLTKATGEDDGMIELFENFLVVCGSVNAASLAQLDCAEAEGFTRIHLPARSVLTPGYFETAEGEAEIEAIVNYASKLIVDSQSDPDEFAAVCEEMDLTVEDIRSRISANLGMFIHKAFPVAESAQIMIIGGDTLYEAMTCAGGAELSPIMEPQTGVVLSTMNPGGVPVLTKSGGFGEPDLLLKLADQFIF